MIDREFELLQRTLAGRMRQELSDDALYGCADCGRGRYLSGLSNYHSGFPVTSSTVWILRCTRGAGTVLMTSNGYKSRGRIYTPEG
jgi:hypothetical protein